MMVIGLKIPERENNNTFDQTMGIISGMTTAEKDKHFAQNSVLVVSKGTKKSSFCLCGDYMSKESKRTTARTAMLSTILH